MGDERREGLVDGIYRVEEPVHKVYVSDFYMGKHEVTKARRITRCNRSTGMR